MAALANALHLQQVTPPPDGQRTSKEACHFRMYQDDVRFLESPKHADFIRVGLGNIDKVTVIDDGDIKQYPVQAYFSSGQECERVVRTRDGWLIKSVIKRAPKRCTDAACASTIKEGESVAW